MDIDDPAYGISRDLGYKMDDALHESIKYLKKRKKMRQKASERLARGYVRATPKRKKSRAKSSTSGDAVDGHNSGEATAGNNSTDGAQTSS
jgi:hypothetical protein